MTPSSFKADFPEFNSVDNATIQRQIDKADPYFEKEVWGAFYEDGLGYFVAHKLASAQAQAAGTASSAGDMVEKKVGEVSVKRDASLINKQMEDPFMRTTYGQEYRKLYKIVGYAATALTV